MRRFHHFISVWLLAACCSSLYAEDDPITAVIERLDKSVEESDATKVMLGNLTTILLKSFDMSRVHGEPSRLARKERPKLPSAKRFHEMYEVPAKVWSVLEGYFLAYDAGEFGGALFFMALDGNGLEHIADGHFDQLALLTSGELDKKRTYLVSGGLSHMAISDGHVSILHQESNGSWRMQPVFKSEGGEPRLVGVISENKGIVAVVDEPLGIWDQHLGIVEDRGAVAFLITKDGAVTFLGTMTPDEEKLLWKKWNALQVEDD